MFRTKRWSLSQTPGGSHGLDCSPKGDKPGFVQVEDDGRTLLIPDRRGNNRIDSIKNVVEDPRVALIFVVPGANETYRVNGRARVSVDPILKRRFAVDVACRANSTEGGSLAHQRRRRPTPLLDARGYRGDLGIRVGPGIFRVWDQPLDRPPLDLVGRPRPLISVADSRDFRFRSRSPL
jgi:hypothetical protein